VEALISVRLHLFAFSLAEPRFLPCFCFSLPAGPLLIFLAASLWATDTFFRPDVADAVPSAQIVWWEHLFIVIFLLPFVVRYCLLDRTWAQFNRVEWLCVVVIGVGGSAMATVALTEGYATGHVALTALLQQFQPIVAMLAARFLLKERMVWKIYLPLAIGCIVGVFLLFWPFVSGTFGDDVRGALFFFFSTICRQFFF
jgi:drug/metabolite transporter (DMT)-like permease